MVMRAVSLCSVCGENLLEVNLSWWSDCACGGALPYLHLPRVSGQSIIILLSASPLRLDLHWAWMPLLSHAALWEAVVVDYAASTRARSTFALSLWLQIISGHGLSSSTSQQWVTNNCRLLFSSKRLKRKASAVFSRCLRKNSSLHTFVTDLLWGCSESLWSAGRCYVFGWLTVILVLQVKLIAALLH